MKIREAFQKAKDLPVTIERVAMIALTALVVAFVALFVSLAGVKTNG